MVVLQLLYYNLFINSFNKYLDHFHFGAFLNKAAMNVHVQVLFWKYTLVCLGEIALK